MLKLTFSDKVDLRQYDVDPELKISASDINDIKHVVNSLSDTVSEKLNTFASLNQFIRINIPSKLPRRI